MGLQECIEDPTFFCVRLLENDALWHVALMFGIYWLAINLQWEQTEREKDD